MGRKILRANAKPGDLIFWAKGGDCANSITHTGIWMRPGWMVNAALPGTNVREQAIWTAWNGISICPRVVRYVASSLSRCFLVFRLG